MPVYPSKLILWLIKYEMGEYYETHAWGGGKHPHMNKEFYSEAQTELHFHNISCSCVAWQNMAIMHYIDDWEANKETLLKSQIILMHFNFIFI